VSEFRFAEPQWAHALWALVAFVVLLFWLERRGGSALGRLVAGPLQSRLVARPSPGRRQLRIVLIGLSMAFLIVALMRPQWGLRHVAAPRVGAEIMICLDVSKSMLAEDVTPNRLERAKAEIADLLAFLEGDQVGLIAFAGRAVVLSPLTPDFGFLRLVLDDAGAHSVARGGTRLGDAIQKAVAGFGPPGDASRAILLITDGEDHDSFPGDAAQAAAEAGIRIIAVGFGDEAGAEVYTTDARTGARTKLVDRDGRAVRSRLDGELLRDLARVTQGAYIPAGTGVLDLESIYRRHIDRLTRGRLDSGGTTIRDEGYQWAVLLALVFLASAIAAAAGASPPASGGPLPGGTLRRGAALVLAIALSPGIAAGSEEPEEAPPASSPTDEPAPAAEPADPRMLYNRGMRQSARGEPDEAERWFRRARREARGDAELRAAAAYNLGWTLVERAEGMRATEPEEALRLLYEAADWFRDAVQQQPAASDSRHNLEVVLRRALLLADQLAREDAASVEEVVQELAERQRALVARCAELLGELGGSEDANAGDRLRREFRGLATEQRVLLSDADRRGSEIGEERDAMRAGLGQGSGTPDDAMRAVQLTNLLHYLHRARERMGQTRRQLRQRQAERGYRRASAALLELKRALDQLRDPVSLLETLVRDATELAAATSTLAGFRSAVPGSELPEAPRWLTHESLGEAQASVAARAEELQLRLRAGIDAATGPEEDRGIARMLDAAREAEPFVDAGQAHLASAATALAGDELERARQEQRAGIIALVEARERFLDLRGLVEAIHADEVQIVARAAAEGEAEKRLRDRSRDTLLAAQRKNLERSVRLMLLLEEERQSADAAEDEAQGGERAAELSQRVERAMELLSLARADMKRVRDELGESHATAAPSWGAVRTSSASAVRHLEGLRRLFFTLVEQLQDAAERQLDLSDATRDVAVLAEQGAGPDAAKLAPLAPAQRELARESGDIGVALEEQSRQEGGADEGEADPADTSRRLRVAAEHVLAAESRMSTAAESLAAEPLRLDVAREEQRGALVELREALALLVDPGQRDGEDSAQSEQESASGQDDQTEAEDGQAMDPAQLLQAVRDREASRRRERAKRGSGEYESVEKDW
jgi:Ca-activated chloride channel family protein